MRRPVGLRYRRLAVLGGAHRPEEALDERDDRLATERRELANVKRRLEYEEADLEELRAHLDNRTERRVAAIRAAPNRRFATGAPVLLAARPLREPGGSAARRLPRMLAYPPAVRAIPESTLRAVPDLQVVQELDKRDGAWLVDCGESGGWAAARPPPDGSLEDTATRVVEDARADRKRLELERERLRGDVIALDLGGSRGDARPARSSHESTSATANARFATSGNSTDANMDAE